MAKVKKKKKEEKAEAAQPPGGEEQTLSQEQIEKMIEEKVKKYGDRLTKEEKKMQIAALKKVFIQGMPPRQAMGISNDFMKVLYAYAYTLYNGGKFTEAAEIFKMLASLEPSVSRYHMGLAASYHKLGNLESAIQCYFTTAVIDPTTPVPLFHISDCYEKLNDHLGVIMGLGGAITRCGDDPKYANLKSRCMALLSAWKKKLGFEKEQIKEEPKKEEKTALPASSTAGGPDIFAQLQESARKKEDAA